MKTEVWLKLAFKKKKKFKWMKGQMLNYKKKKQGFVHFLGWRKPHGRNETIQCSRLILQIKVYESDKVVKDLVLKSKEYGYMGKKGKWKMFPT